MNKTFVWLCGIVVVLAVLCHAASRAQQSGNGPVTGEDLTSRFDWVMGLQVKQLKNYLDYPASTINPITEIATSYRLCGRFHQNDAGELVAYEDLWYKGSAPIGCRRYHNLDVPYGQQGLIRVSAGPASDIKSHSPAVANAIALLLLDVYRRRLILTTIVVPQDAFTPIIESLGTMHFFTYEPLLVKSVPAAATLTVMSDPPGQTAHIYYDEGR